jgi:DNA modification methylase
MGSASTALACIQSEIFDYLGYELDNNYFNIAMSRING